jgi:hypothetical protein
MEGRQVRIRAFWSAVLLAGCAATTFAQGEQIKPVAAKPEIVSGTVITYEAGHAIVVREADKKEVEYALAPNLGVPPGVKVGSNVTLTTEPGPNGTVTVKRIVIDTVTPTGERRRLKEEIRVAPDGTTTMSREFANVSGKVVNYESGKFITIKRPDGTEVTYGINAESALPAGLAVGRNVTVTPSHTMTGNEQNAQRIVYSHGKRSRTKHRS